MKIYFFGNSHSTPQLHKRFSYIIEIFEKMGILVFSNLKKKESFTQEVQKMMESEESMIEKIDALIIEGSNQSFESAHLIALALAHKKQTLYAVEKNKYIDKNLLKLQEDGKTKKFFRIEFYTDETLEKILKDFINVIEVGVEDSHLKPTIKFTLRVTPKLERYLKWKTHNSKLSKADYIRDKLEEFMKKDEEYNKFIKEE